MADSNLPSLPAWIDEYVATINIEISHLYKGVRPLETVVMEALSTRGKRVRAIVALLWCEAVSGNFEQAIPIAVAYELAHAAALVQDDIIDGSATRRGQGSIVGKYGIPKAILTSNMLLFQVPKKLAEYAAMKTSSATLGRLFDMLGESYGAATLGEFLDLEMVRANNLSEIDYEQMIRLKTGALIGASSASGAIIGGGDTIGESILDDAYRFGELLGMAYQVQDDLLDLLGNETLLGKPSFTDLKSGKRNLVLIHTLKNCSEDERAFIAGLIGKGSYEAEQIERARALFAKYGSIEHARKVSLEYTSRAKELLSKLDRSKAIDRLDELCDYLSNRNY